LSTKEDGRAASKALHPLFGIGVRFDRPLHKTSGRLVPAPSFGLMIPTEVADVPTHALDRRQALVDGADFDRTAHDLIARLKANFESFAGDVGGDVKAAAVRAAA
jgi:ATP-dependent phosphoenolpyruvate carboxykinase